MIKPSTTRATATKILFLVCVLLISLTSNAQLYSGYVGDVITLPEPTPRGGYELMTANYSSSSLNLEVSNNRVYIRHYFTGNLTVECWYTCVRQYYVADRLYEDWQNMTTYYYISCLPVNISGIPSTIMLEEGDEQTITPSFSPIRSITPDLDWSSSNSKVVSVDYNGYSAKIKAKSAGNAIINIENNSGPDQYIQVVVNERRKVVLTATPPSGEVVKGTIVKLSSNVAGTDIHYTLDGSKPSQESNAYSSTGIIIDKSCTLKAIGYKTDYEASEILSEDYSVVLPVSPTSISVDVAKRSIKIGETTNALCNYSPKNANYNTQLTWTSDDISIATVNESGEVKGVGQGVTLIYAETANGKKAYCKINVEEGRVSSSFDDGTGVCAIAVGTGCSHVVKNDGSLWGYGANNVGQVGNGNLNTQSVPKKLMDDVSSVVAGSSNTFAIKNDHSVWSCGYNYYAQLGDGEGTRPTFKKVMEDAKMVSPASDGRFTLFVKDDGTLWVCGTTDIFNNGETKQYDIPTKLMDDVQSVAAGTAHVLIVKNDESLWTIGYNSHGELGNGTEEDTFTPQKIMNDVKSVAAGNDHSLVVKKDGSLWAFGYNWIGQLGDGTDGYGHRSTPFKLMDDVTSVAAGENYSLVIKKDSSLWACGSNSNGKLGVNSTEHVLIPVKVTDNVFAVSGGNAHTMIIKYDGSLWACGWNKYYQLGDGTTTSRHIPVRITRGMTEAKPMSIIVNPIAQTLKRGESANLSCLVKPMYVESSVTWSSDNPKIATVDSTTGEVTGLRPGTTYINATTDNGKVDWCKVTVYVDTVEQSIKTSDAGYATFYDSQSAYSLPEGLTAQVVIGVSNNKLVYFTIATGANGDLIPAAVPVMLVSDLKAAKTVTLTSVWSEETYTGINLLRGSDDPTMTTSDGNCYFYKLAYGPKTDSKLKDVFGWYWGAQNGDAFQIEGHKAWLVVPKAAGTRSFTINGEASGFIGVDKDDLNPNYAIYDLQGNCISNSQMKKGLYIQNGMKVIVK